MYKILLIVFISSFTFAEVDCVGIEDGNTICLGFDAVDQNAGSFDITYNSLHPISGFQFNLSEIARDRILMQNGWKIEWVFEGTASKNLMQSLIDAGIPFKFI